MICYMDTTFCTFYNECADGSVCGRALTPAVREAAERWWGNSNAPIAIFSIEPTCFVDGDDLEEE